MKKFTTMQNCSKSNKNVLSVVLVLSVQGCKTKLFDLLDDNMPLLGGVLGALIGVQVCSKKANLKSLVYI